MGSGKLSLLICSLAGTLVFSTPASFAIPRPSDTAHTTSRPSAIAPDIKPAALWDGRKIVDFHAIDFPAVVPAAKASFLDANEYVLGITVNGESRAYPTRFAAWHHIINDKLGKAKNGGEAFVTVTY